MAIGPLYAASITEKPYGSSPRIGRPQAVTWALLRGLKEPGEIVGDDDAAQDYRCAGTMRFPPPRRILPHLEGKCADTQSEVDTKVNNLSTVAGLSCTSTSYVKYDDDVRHSQGRHG